MKKVVLLILMFFCVNGNVLAKINDTNVDVSVGSVEKKEYQVSKGANQNYKLNSSSYMEFEINTNKVVNDITIKIDDKTLNKDNYKLSGVPLKININNEYLKNLELKKHEITFELEDGFAKTNFELEKETTIFEDIFDLPPDTFVRYTRDMLILLVGALLVVRIVLSRKK